MRGGTLHTRASSLRKSRPTPAIGSQKEVGRARHEGRWWPVPGWGQAHTATHPSRLRTEAQGGRGHHRPPGMGPGPGEAELRGHTLHCASVSAVTRGHPRVPGQPQTWSLSQHPDQAMRAQGTRSGLPSCPGPGGRGPGQARQPSDCGHATPHWVPQPLQGDELPHHDRQTLSLNRSSKGRDPGLGAEGTMGTSPGPRPPAGEAGEAARLLPGPRSCCSVARSQDGQHDPPQQREPGRRTHHEKHPEK